MTVRVTSRILTAAVAVAAVAAVLGCDRKKVESEALYSSPGLTVTRDSIIAEGKPLVSAESAGRVFAGTMTFDIPEQTGAPLLVTESPLVDAAYSLGAAATAEQLEADSAGAEEWFDIWLRGALMDHERSSRLLAGAVSPDKTVDDAGWPLRTTRGLWIIAAREVYRAGGSAQWLEFAADVARNILSADTSVIIDRQTGLVHGYGAIGQCNVRQWPRWMDNVGKYECMTLLDNCIEVGACSALADMLGCLGSGDSAVWRNMSVRIANAVNLYMWQPDLGRYGEYLYSGIYPIASRISDNTAQPLAMIMDIPIPQMSALIFGNTPRLAAGMPGFYPSPAGTPPVRASGISPAVEELWALAAARNSRGSNVAVSYATILGLIFGDSGISYQAAGASATIALRVFAGLTPGNDRLEFHPSVPYMLRGGIRLAGVKYRDSILDISITGSGNRIAGFAIDGMESSGNFVDCSLTGSHRIDIQLANNSFTGDEIAVADQIWSPGVPEIEWPTARTGVVRDNSPGLTYCMYVNGSLYDTFDSPSFTIPDSRAFERVCVVPVSKTGIHGISASPHDYMPAGSVRTLQAEDFADAGTALVRDRKLSPRFVESSSKKNEVIRIETAIERQGDYMLRLCYANGAEPERCAIRLLRVNGEPAGAFVMPGRGVGWWLATGYSNALRASLRAGVNVIEIESMPGVGDAPVLIDYLRLFSL